MIQTIKRTLLTNWSFMRWFRLALGSVIGVQAIVSHDTFSGMLAAFLLIQAATNRGCCGSEGCGVPQGKMEPDETKEITYEEIKKIK